MKTITYYSGDEFHEEEYDFEIETGDLQEALCEIFADAYSISLESAKNIAEELKNLRQQQGWSQEDLARTLGVSFATVNRWENGKTKPSRLAQEKIKQVANMGK